MSPMTMQSQYFQVFFLSLLLITGVPVFADEVVTQSTAAGLDSNGGEQLQLIRVSGFSEPSGIRLTLEVGRQAFEMLDIESIRVYSEPSHTLMASVARHGAVMKDDGQKAASLTLPSLADAAPIVLTTARRSPEDVQVIVYMVGAWPDGTTSERAVAGGKVGFSAFDFTAWVGSEYMTGKITTIRQCCNSYECASQVCAVCSPFRFSCCVCGEPECCFAECTLDTICDCVPCWNGCFLIPHSCY